MDFDVQAKGLTETLARIIPPRLYLAVPASRAGFAHGKPSFIIHRIVEQ